MAMSFMLCATGFARPSYVHDEAPQGSFFIRNSENIDNDLFQTTPGCIFSEGSSSDGRCLSEW